MIDSFAYILYFNSFYQYCHRVPYFTSGDVVYITVITSPGNDVKCNEMLHLFKSCMNQSVYSMNSKLICLVL